MPVSANACAASADIAVDRVTTAAADFASATPRFVAIATATVRALSSAKGRARSSAKGIVAESAAGRLATRQWYPLPPIEIAETLLLSRHRRVPINYP